MKPRPVFAVVPRPPPPPVNSVTVSTAGSAWMMAAKRSIFSLMAAKETS
jgi:hypothetical protein